MNSLRFLAEHVDILRRAALLILLIVAVAMLASNAALHNALIGVLDVAADVIERYPRLGMVVFVVSSALSAMLAFVSVAVVVPVAVHTWGAFSSAVLLWVGWILGGSLSYAAGKALGRPVMQWVTSQATLQKIESKVHGNMKFWSVVLLQLALPSEIPGYLLGAARYGFVKYLSALAIAELPYTAVTVLLSETFLERQTVLLLCAGAATVALSIGAIYMMKRRVAAGK